MPGLPLVVCSPRCAATSSTPTRWCGRSASGRQRGSTPRWRRVELRYVDLKAGRHLQVTAYDDTQAHTSNHLVGEDARQAVDGLLDEPFGNWHVDTTTQSHQVRVTKKLEAILHSTDRDEWSTSNATTTATRTGCCPRTTRCSWPWGSPTTRAG